jgi:hypothetical protein
MFGFMSCYSDGEAKTDLLLRFSLAGLEGRHF